jgi:hypothetical protein
MRGKASNICCRCSPIGVLSSVMVALGCYFLFMLGLLIFQHQRTATLRQISPSVISPVQINTVPRLPSNFPLVTPHVPSSPQVKVDPLEIHSVLNTQNVSVSIPIVQKATANPLIREYASNPPILSIPFLLSTPKYLPKSIVLVTQHQPKESPAVLIVGGTDGSGTRRVVQILTELGVKMVSEDPETYDIHADLVGGWPPIVSPVLKETHSLKYHPEKLSNHLKTKEAHDLERLLEQVKRDSIKPTSHKLAVGGVLPKPAHIDAKYVQYGFKAPVAMTLVPYWIDLLPSSIFIHVLRDGRDIAFSANQGPVQKFYHDMYSHQHDFMHLQSNVKGIKLWSDWNVDVYQYSKDIVEDINKKNQPKIYGYFQLHSEDLVSSNRQIRFAAIYNLAQFLGSTITENEICCLAYEDSEFMGSHDRTPIKKSAGETQVSSRYGKWRLHTQNNPTLLKDLYHHGHAGLRLFGYEPLRSLATEDMVTTSGYQCVYNETLCHHQKGHFETVDQFISASNWVEPGKCDASYGFDYVGGSSLLLLLLLVMIVPLVFLTLSLSLYLSFSYF